MPRIRKTQNQPTISRIVWRIAVYIRLSKDDGNDESLSVTNQRKIITEYIEEFFEGEYIIVDVYADDGLTGTDYERPEFQRLIHDVEAGTVNCIICKTLSRAFRNYSDQGYFLEKVFPLYGVRFISIGDPSLDTFKNPDAVQGMEVPITGLMNDRYAAKTSNDVRRTFNTKRRKGEFIGAFAPYGYVKDPENKNAFVIDEEAAEVVRNIFHWFVDEGMSKLGITKKLTEMGIPTPTAYKHSKGLNLQTPRISKNDGMWGISTVCTILKNEMYIGNMVQGKQKVISYKVHEKIAPPKEEWFIVENTHEAIIDRETFDKAQRLQERDTRTAPGKKQLYLFSGLLRCADCQRSMTRKTCNKPNKTYVYYVCSTYVFKSKDKCTRHVIKEEVLHKAVLKAVQAQISLVGDMAEVVKEINRTSTVCTQSKRLQQLLKDRSKELEKLTCVTDNLYMDWKCGDITRAEYVRMKAKFEQQAEQVKGIIANLQTEIQLSEKGVGNDNPYLTTFLKHENVKSLDRGLLVELIDTIYVHENNEITIQFNFADQHKRIVEFIENNQHNLELIKSNNAV